MPRKRSWLQPIFFFSPLSDRLQNTSHVQEWEQCQMLGYIEIR
jgi:hypothetical protein